MNEMNYINYPLEALEVIYDILNNKNSIEEMITKIKSQDNLEFKRLDNLLQFSKSVLNSLKELSIDNSLNKFYNEYGDNILIKTYYRMKIELKKTNKETRDYFYNSLLEYLNCYQSDEVIEIINGINKADITDSCKVALIDFYFNYEQIIHQFDLIIEQVTISLKKNIDILITELELAYEEALESKLLLEKHNIKPKEEDRLYLSIYNCNQISLITVEDTLVYYYGYLAEFIYLSKLENESSHKNTIATIKTLGDPTRFNIIKLLKESEMCNQDLSKALKLSEATLSHHIDNLIGYELIVITKIEKKKYYYSLNKRRILFISEFIKELTNEEIS